MRKNAKFRRTLLVVIAINMMWSLSIKSLAANKPPPQSNDTDQSENEKGSESKEPIKEVVKLVRSFSLIGLFLETLCKSAFQELFKSLKKCIKKLIKPIKKRLKSKKKNIRHKCGKHGHKK